MHLEDLDKNSNEPFLYFDTLFFPINDTKAIATNYLNTSVSLLVGFGFLAFFSPTSMNMENGQICSRYKFS